MTHGNSGIQWRASDDSLSAREHSAFAKGKSAKFSPEYTNVCPANTTA